MLLILFLCVNQLFEDKVCWNFRLGYLHSWVFLSNFSASLPTLKKNPCQAVQRMSSFLFSLHTFPWWSHLLEITKYHLLANNSWISISSPNLFLNSRIWNLTVSLIFSLGWLVGNLKPNTSKENLWCAQKALPHPQYVSGNPINVCVQAKNLVILFFFHNRCQEVSLVIPSKYIWIQAISSKVPVNCLSPSVNFNSLL